MAICDARWVLGHEGSVAKLTGKVAAIVQPAAAPNRIDHMSYLADMVAELMVMAKGAQLDRLATILDLARDEAERQLDAARQAGAGRDHR
jgi:hypothetical protein